MSKEENKLKKKEKKNKSKDNKEKEVERYISMHDIKEGLKLDD